MCSIGSNVRQSNSDACKSSPNMVLAYQVLAQFSVGPAPNQDAKYGFLVHRQSVYLISSILSGTAVYEVIRTNYETLAGFEFDFQEFLKNHKKEIKDGQCIILSYRPADGKARFECLEVSCDEEQTAEHEANLAKYGMKTLYPNLDECKYKEEDFHQIIVLKESILPKLVGIPGSTNDVTAIHHDWHCANMYVKYLNDYHRSVVANGLDQDRDDLYQKFLEPLAESEVWITKLLIQLVSDAFADYIEQSSNARSIQTESSTFVQLNQPIQVNINQLG